MDNIITTDEPETADSKMTLLRRAIAREKDLGASGHWAYDAARHAGLLRQYQKLTASRSGIV